MTCQVFVRRRAASVSDGEVVQIVEELSVVLGVMLGVPAEFAVFDIGRLDVSRHDIQVTVFVPSELDRRRSSGTIAKKIGETLERVAPVHNRIGVQVISVVGAFVDIPASCPT